MLKNNSIFPNFIELFGPDHFSAFISLLCTTIETLLVLDLYIIVEIIQSE